MIEDLHDVLALRACSPTELIEARVSAHQAAKLLADAARANLPAAPDYSHVSLSWRRSGACASSTRWRLVSAAFPGGLTLALEIGSLALCLIEDNASAAAAQMDAFGRPVEEARAWLSAELSKRGLRPAAAVEPNQVDHFELPAPAAFGALENWFALAASALEGAARAAEAAAVAPVPVRCWPHHFDIAFYAALEQGDPETAKGVGVGMSPGDESYDQPYFYVNPWPAPAPAALPTAPAPGGWRTEAFTGIVATAEQVLEAGAEQPKALAAYLAAGFNTARSTL